MYVQKYWVFLLKSVSEVINVWNAGCMCPLSFYGHMSSLNSTGNCTEVTDNGEGLSVVVFVFFFLSDILSKAVILGVL